MNIRFAFESRIIFVQARKPGRQIAATDREIGALVDELFELTDEEIRLVEEALPDT